MDFPLLTGLGSALLRHLTVGAASARRANKGRQLAVGRLRSRGYRLHGEDDAALWAESLGVLLGGAAGAVQPPAARRWKPQCTFRFLGGPPVTCGVQLERALGHATFTSLVRRGLVSISSAARAFVRPCYRRAWRLWKPVKRECAEACALVPRA